MMLLQCDSGCLSTVSLAVSWSPSVPSLLTQSVHPPITRPTPARALTAPGISSHFSPIIICICIESSVGITQMMIIILSLRTNCWHRCTGNVATLLVGISTTNVGTSCLSQLKLIHTQSVTQTSEIDNQNVNISKWFPTKVSGYHMNDYFRRKHPLGQGIYLNMVFGINQGRPS